MYFLDEVFYSARRSSYRFSSAYCPVYLQESRALLCKIETEKNEVEPIIPKYLNRLSDYLFILARYTGHLLNTRRNSVEAKNLRFFPGKSSSYLIIMRCEVDIKQFSHLSYAAPGR